MRLEAAIFDLDGVLADTAVAHFRAWKRLARELGIHFDERINQRLKGIPRLESLDILLGPARSRYSQLEKDELAARKNGYYRQIIRNVSIDDLLPGALDALRACKAGGVKTALASASKNAPTLVENLGIAELLDFVADANFVHRHKPHPEIFLTAAKGVGVPPRNCIAFEDAEAGIEAIKAAKMLAIGIGDRRVLPKADFVFDSLADFSFAEFRAALSGNDEPA